MKRLIIASSVGTAISCVVFWLGGFNFDQRGEAAAMAVVCSLALAFMSYVILELASEAQ